MLALNFIGLELYALEILPILLGESKLFPPARQACESAPSTATYCPLPDNPYSIQAAYGHASFWLGIPMACLLSFGPRLAIKGWHGVVGTPTKNAMLVRSRRRDDRNSGKLRVLVEHDGGGSDGRPSTGGGDGSSTGPQIARRNTPTGYAFSESEPATCRVLTLTARRLGGATAQAHTRTHTHTGLSPPVPEALGCAVPSEGGNGGGRGGSGADGCGNSTAHRLATYRRRGTSTRRAARGCKRTCAPRWPPRCPGMGRALLLLWHWHRHRPRPTPARR